MVVSVACPNQSDAFRGADSRHTHEIHRANKFGGLDFQHGRELTDDLKTNPRRALLELGPPPTSSASFSCENLSHAAGADAALGHAIGCASKGWPRNMPTTLFLIFLSYR
jgi:hypothetical protein